jgi:anti-sigma regulatory factor (Ser/Thr protein kinase)
MLVRATLGKLCEMVQCPAEVQRQVVLAVDEACANIIKHTFQGDPCQSITVVCKGDEESLEIVLTDCGPRVDVQRVRPRDINELRPGGLGTHFIRSIMDQVDYRFEEGCGNVLRMVKYLRKTDPD